MVELLLGASLGLAAGLAPGPLLGLVVTGALQRGLGAGLRIAAAPLLTDAPIIALTLLLLSSLPARAVAVLAVAGGAYVVLLGVTTVRQAGTPDPPAGRRTDLIRGALVNLLSPHPWLFWLGAGGPLLLTAWRRTPSRGLAFLVGFYALLVGSKAVIAAVTAASRHRLGTPARRRLVVLAGVLLVLLGAALVLRYAGGLLG